MTRTVVCIVEGDGEVKAVPVLLRRLAESRGVFDLVVPPPIRVHRDQFLRRENEFERKLLLAAAKARGGMILVMLDADDGCPVTLAQTIEARAKPFVQGATLKAVIPNREYEAWLLSAAESIAGRRGLKAGIVAPPQSDDIRNAKGWLSERMPAGRYHEVSDQPALTAIFDIEDAAGRSRSFRKLLKTFETTILSSAAIV